QAAASVASQGLGERLDRAQRLLDRAFELDVALDIGFAKRGEIGAGDALERARVRDAKGDARLLAELVAPAVPELDCKRHLCARAQGSNLLFDAGLEEHGGLARLT